MRAAVQQRGALSALGRSPRRASCASGIGGIGGSGVTGMGVARRRLPLSLPRPAWAAMSSTSVPPAAPPGEPAAERPLSKIYERKTPVEHVLLRPDTYVGSTLWANEEHWVVSKPSGQEASDAAAAAAPQESRPQMTRKDCKIVPGLYKIFDEILVNASDNFHRGAGMTELRVDIDASANRISIFNNGLGIPVARHETEKIFIPELVLGNLLTGSNFDDSVAKVTGGRNGYGAKLTNIFSSEFSVETVDARRGLRYEQHWHNNMSVRDDPIVSPSPAGQADFTRVSFVPDLSKFGMKSLNDGDFIKLVERRVYDMAGVLPGVSVLLNGERISLDFQQYLEMYPIGVTEGGMIGDRVFKRVNDRWSIVLGVSTSGQFEQVSFVNGIATTKGGTHVTHVADQVIGVITEQLSKKHKDLIISPAQIRSHLFVAVNCLIENPAFTSQVKEFLTTKPSQFGSTCRIPKTFLASFVNDSGTLDFIASWARARQQVELNATGSEKRRGRVSGIPKLYDAAWAGGPRASECTLVLTEGDSAKALAIAGLSTVGRQQYGVFPLRGKPLNVRDANHKQLIENVELNHVKTILGLSHDREYKDDGDIATLRYGKVMLMTDQDHDGSHIKGLMINFFHTFWPELLKRGDFLQEFVTPIVKVTKGGRVTSFFTIPEYEAWVEQQEAQGTLAGHKVKYYKGLGTNTSAEAKEYFQDLETHRLSFTWCDDPDSGELINMAFAKNQVEQRKDWLRELKDGTYLDHSKKTLSFSDFINHELILFSHTDNLRSIPSVVDGLKPGQRKVLFACFKRRLQNEIKVAQLAGYVAEHTAYHHGEMSLHGTIINMAQDFVGSNNIPLLAPVGQFGTRLQGGKDAASGRYLFTHLTALTRQLFPETDDVLMEAQYEDNEQIEPKFYCPIIPLVLVNGARGLGTGWSTQIQQHHPLEVIDNVLRHIRGEEMQDMSPWSRGFSGKIIKDKKGRVRSCGTVQKIDAQTVQISELPLGVWTDDYKELLDSLARPKPGSKAMIKGYDEAHTENTVRFVVRMSARQLEIAERIGLLKVFKLEHALNSTNMHMFQPDGQIKHYDDVRDIITDFCSVRKMFYVRRKQFLLEKTKLEHERLQSKLKFTELVASQQLPLFNRSRVEIEADLERFGIPRLSLRESAVESALAAIGAVNSTTPVVDLDAAGAHASYEYLLRTPVLQLTKERLSALQHESRKKDNELVELHTTPEQVMWEQDLMTLRGTVERMLKKDKAKYEW